MVAPIGRRQSGPRAAPQKRELALDLTPDEVVLHEGNAAEGWRRFAGVAIEDPLFLEMMGLLRAEAEEALGGARPVRLWLPPEQVLVVDMAIDETGTEARLDAAFDRIADTAGHDPDAVALAVSPAASGTRATVLVAYAETLQEARDYAARWGFRPGPVSTRHRAEAFAPGEPVFRLRRARGTGESPSRDRATWAALGIAAVAWALTATPADATAAPGRTPMPAARVDEPAPGPATPAPVDAHADGAAVLAFLPPPRPGRVPPEKAPPERAALGGITAPLPPDSGSAGGPGRNDAMPGPEWRAGAGGFACPLPPTRPDRPAAARPAAMSAMLPAIGAAAPPPVRAAAAERGLPLDSVALIGILNLDTGREALLRLPDGRFATVGVGDVLEGWRVSAIGVDAMRVSRDGKDRTLLLVSR